MSGADKVNILLVDDQPAKLMSYEVILRDIDVNLIKASSGRDALECLLKTEIAVVLMDVCMPELDGFELAAMIRDHPRFRRTAIIFISAIHLTDVDRLRGYEMGAVDYVPVPVIPEVLRAKVRIFTELYRKSRQLEQLNAELERRVADRTAELERSTRRLQQSEDRRNLALAAGKMGSWDWDLVHGDCVWDEGQKQIFGVDSTSFDVTLASVRALIDDDDWNVAPGPQAGPTGCRLPSSRVPHSSPRWRRAVVPRYCRGEQRRGQSGFSHQRGDHRYHRPQRG
jgi:DNA-binding response OmpR family regulator